MVVKGGSARLRRSLSLWCGADLATRRTWRSLRKPLQGDAVYYDYYAVLFS